MRARRDFDPVGNYNWAIELDGIAIGKCSGVDGLAYELELIEYRVSDQPNLPRFRPGLSKFGSITLKGGWVANTEFNDWLAQCQAGIHVHKDLTIYLHDNAGMGVSGWNLFRCLPTKWAVTSIDGKGNECLFQTLELRVEEAEIVGDPPDAREGALPRVIVTKEAPTGRNLEFKDTVTGREMNVDEFADSIESGQYQDYTVRDMKDGSRVPAAKPNDTTADNLG